MRFCAFVWGVGFEQVDQAGVIEAFAHLFADLACFVRRITSDVHAFAAVEKTDPFDPAAPERIGDFVRIGIDAGIEQVDVQVLARLDVALQVKLGMLARGAVGHRADQIEIVLGQKFHHGEGGPAQLQQVRGLGVGLEQALVFAQGRFDFIVVGQEILGDPRGAGHFARRLALGGGVIETRFGHQTRGGGRNLFPDTRIRSIAHGQMVSERGRPGLHCSASLESPKRVGPRSLRIHADALVRLSMHIHILGICGTFMGGVAVLARQAGHRVTGCDANVYPPMSTQLEAQGIELIQGWDPAQLALTPDLYVIGNVVTRGNPLMEAILDRGLPYTSGPQWVAEHILAGRWVLAVAGTHGKTTTSSMLAWILEDAGYAPGFLIGGVPRNFEISARLHGAKPSEFFVIEADEYDTAFFDKRSKFVHYRPKTAILNNLEFDHADIFPDLGAIETQFHHLVRTVPGIGRLIVNGDDPALARVLARGCWSEVERFGADADWTLAENEAGAQVLHAGVACGALAPAVLAGALQGRHNRLNALAAIAAARHVGVPPAQAIDALSRFASVKRRMELRGTQDGVRVYDDFAHHPTAIATTIDGLRRVVGSARILAVVEPRSNTMKLGVMKAQLPEALRGADLVYGYGAQAGKDRLDWDLAGALAPLGAQARAFDALPELVAAVVRDARPGDSVLVMSNGGFGGVHQKLLDALAERAKEQG